jgi:two-component system response regulator RegA|tara:strand:+ start:153547 stop:154074 length:528 start_codon:yes stop_codon:yes gene_type:complete
MRILIVDDDEVFVQTLARSLKRRDIESEVALNQRSALEAVAQTQFGAILLDLRLGEESGLSILEDLRAAVPDARILILTGYSSISTAVEAIKLGADNYLPKPAGAEEILRALDANPDGCSITQIPEQSPSLNRLEWEHIQRALSCNDGNISASARELGMHRRTLQRKLAKRPVRK